MSTLPRLQLLREGQKPRRIPSPFGPIPGRAEKSIEEATNLLTFCSVCAMVFEGQETMPTTKEVIAALNRRLGHEQSRVFEIRNEMSHLQPMYDRYLDLMQEADDRRKRTQRIAAVLGPGSYLWADKLSKKGQPHDPSEVKKIEASVRHLRKNLALWEAIEQYLALYDEARMTDVQAFLEAVGIGPASRQAIESAVRSHPDLFRTTKRGAARYYSLKSRSLD